MGSGDVDPDVPTQLAGLEDETQSVRAWGLAEDYEERAPRLSAKRITIAAVAVSAVLVAVASVVVWQHLRTEEPMTTAATGVMVPAAVVPTVTVAPPVVPPATVTVTAAPPVSETVAAAPVPTRRTFGTYTTFLFWTGSACLQAYVPDGPRTRSEVSCNGSQEDAVHHSAYTREMVGADPVMGSNTIIACRVVNDANGAVVHQDYGTMGDGHDVNCIVGAP